jgi:hypothetical protein
MVILIFRILRISHVNPRIQWLTIFQRFESLSTLIDRWTSAKTPKKNSHKETIAINLIQRITHLPSQRHLKKRAE